MDSLKSNAWLSSKIFLPQAFIISFLEKLKNTISSKYKAWVFKNLWVWAQVTFHPFQGEMWVEIPVVLRCYYNCLDRCFSPSLIMAKYLICKIPSSPNTAVCYYKLVKDFFFRTVPWCKNKCSRVSVSLCKSTWRHETLKHIDAILL